MRPRSGTEPLDAAGRTGPCRDGVRERRAAPASVESFGRPLEFPRSGRAEGDPVSIRRNADAFPDEEQFIGVMAGNVRTLTADGDAQIVVVLNWFDELRRLLPVH